MAPLEKSVYQPAEALGTSSCADDSTDVYKI